MSYVLIIVLALISALVAIGVSRKVNMWGWITIYWIVLLIKNIMDAAEV